MPLRDKDRDQDKPTADLLRRSLAAPAGAPGSDIDACPDPEILAAYAERSLGADEAARCNLHFSQCARCREQLAALVRSGEFAGAAERKPSRAPGMPWIGSGNWDWRWIAPATAMLLFVVVVAIFRPPHHPAGQASQPLVAMNQAAAPPTTSVASESAPNSSSATGSLARTSPNSIFAKSEAAPPPNSTALAKKQDLPASNGSSSNEKELDRLEVSDELSTPPNVATPAAQVPRNAATAPVISPARVPATPVPPDISNSTTASGASPAAGAALKSARSEQMSAAVVTNRSFAQTESVVVQAGDATSARTLVRTPDPQVLWRFSSGRFVERSSDAGATWRVQWTNANAHLLAGAAPTTDTCWLVGRDAMILLTTDGKMWKTITPPADADFVDVAATDASSATVTTKDDRKFTTSDNGKHWSPAP